MKKLRGILLRLIVSFFWIGYIRPFSATWGSLASGIALYFFWPDVDPLIKAQSILLVFIFGWVLSYHVEKQSKTHDPYYIVIDEVVGMMICTFMLPRIWSIWIAVFLLFRFFDIAKPWPASFFDKRKGGFAIMFDDVIAALYTLAVLKALSFAMHGY